MTERETAEDEVFARADAIRYVGQDAEFLRDLLKMFCAHRGEVMDRISVAIDNDAADDLREASHRLKGMLASFFSIHAADTTGKLELAGKSGNLETAAGLFSRLDGQIDVLCAAVDALASELE